MGYILQNEWWIFQQPCLMTRRTWNPNPEATAGGHRDLAEDFFWGEVLGGFAKRSEQNDPQSFVGVWQGHPLS